jgi:ADP-ribosylation factor GTPase-activating protein 2/3
VLTSHRFPNEVVLAEADGADSATPAGEPDDDFFSSWDKPAIKKPTPPVSRTATPPVVGRTPSPFLNPGANGKDLARAPSPLSKSETSETKSAASRVVHSSALKKTATGPKKANVLGAKKATKLGVKKVTGDTIDFDEAEKKAKEEAERIEKLGYDPDAEDELAAKKSGATKTESAAAIISPTPVSPIRGGYGNASHSREKSASEMERLGMGIGRLGFGQVGGNKPAPQKKAAGGFGSVGPIKAAAEGGHLKSLQVHR